MSGKKFAVIVGLLVVVQASVLWWLNGWNATHAVMYGIAAVLIVGAGVFHLREDDE